MPGQYPELSRKYDFLTDYQSMIIDHVSVEHYWWLFIVHVMFADEFLDPKAENRSIAVFQLWATMFEFDPPLMKAFLMHLFQCLYETNSHPYWLISFGFLSSLLVETLSIKLSFAEANLYFVEASTSFW